MDPHGLGLLLSTGSLLSFTAAILVTQKATGLMPLAQGFLVATATNVLFSALFFGVQWALQSTPLTWNLTALACFLGAGVLSTWLGRWFFYESVMRMGPAKASLFQVSSPLFTALVAWLLLGEALPHSVFVAMSMVVAGLATLSLKPLQALAEHTGRSGAPAALAQPMPSGAGRLAGWRGSLLLLGLGSSLAYGLGNVLRGSAIRDWNEPILGGLLGAASGLLMHLLFTPAKREMFRGLKAAPRRGLWLFAFLGAATISGQILSISAMRHIPVSVAALVNLCTPLLVIPLSRVFYGKSEKITPDMLLGTFLTLAGMSWVVTR